jgi:hypothetical protein
MSSETEKCKTTIGGNSISKADIDQQGNKIREVDTWPQQSDNSSSSLHLFCYTKCTAEDNKVVQGSRGTIFDNQNKNIIQSFPFTPEYTTEDSELIEKFGDVSSCQVYDAHEGALLRVFHHEGTWFFATHRKFDANRSKWASRQSFGEQLTAALSAEYQRNSKFRERCGDPGKEPEAKIYFSRESPENNEIDVHVRQYLDTLDKDWCYCFLVRNTKDNRIVCQAPVDEKGNPEAIVYHVGSFKKYTNEFSLSLDINIPSPKKHNFESWSQVYDYVKSTNHDELQGIIAVAPDARHIKILGSRYSYLFQIRGNEPSIKFRYLQLRMNPKKVDDLYLLYPGHHQEFENYENILYLIAKNIHSAYVNRYIKKQYVTLDKEPYAVMDACHKWHKADREKNRISVRKVQQVLNEQRATDLNKMIRQHMQQERKAHGENVEIEAQGSAIQASIGTANETKE